MKKEILIIGGGFAGLAAGVFLSEKGHSVTLIERRGHLGGRAYSFTDPITQSTLDNGQHALMGCYRDTFDFLKKIGTDDDDKLWFQKELQVEFREKNRKPVFLKARSLPAPWHLVAGFLLFKGLTLTEKLSVSKVRQALQVMSDHNRQKLDQITVSEWLTSLGQSQNLQDRFWTPLTLAALNDEPQVSSAALFEPVLREALFGSRRDSAIVLPKVGFEELYAEPARRFIEERGGHFILKSPVKKLHFHGLELAEVELEEGRRLTAELVLCTTPFTVLKRILPEEILYSAFFTPLLRLETSPIVAVNLWFERDFVKSPFVGFYGSKTHWLFNKSFLHGTSSSSDGNSAYPAYYSCVTSGAREQLKKPAADLIRETLEEIYAIYPEARSIKLLHTMIQKEPEATMAPLVGTATRLPQRTPYSNFFIAGDWTQTGLPATIESAVRSARQAVDCIL